MAGGGGAQLVHGVRGQGRLGKVMNVLSPEMGER